MIRTLAALMTALAAPSPRRRSAEGRDRRAPRRVVRRAGEHRRRDQARVGAEGRRRRVRRLPDARTARSSSSTTRTRSAPRAWTKVVADSTLDELRKLDVGKWKDEKFAGEKIPTLDEMLATVPAGKRVFIEVKCGPESVPELDRVLKASKLKPEQTPVISFNADVIAAVKKARPDLQALLDREPRAEEREAAQRRRN